MFNNNSILVLKKLNIQYSITFKNFLLLEYGILAHCS